MWICHMPGALLDLGRALVPACWPNPLPPGTDRSHLTSLGTDTNIPNFPSQSSKPHLPSLAGSFPSPFKANLYPPHTCSPAYEGSLGLRLKGSVLLTNARWRENRRMVGIRVDYSPYWSWTHWWVSGHCSCGVLPGPCPALDPMLHRLQLT